MEWNGFVAQIGRCSGRAWARGKLVGMSAPAKPKYRTTNWKDYNTATARGSLLIWLDKDVCWHGITSGKQGRRRKYSEAAIQFCLTIKGLFNLALRQAMGMAQSLLKLAGLDWEVPALAP